MLQRNCTFSLLRTLTPKALTCRNAFIPRTKENYVDIVADTLQNSKIHSPNDWKCVRSAILDHNYNRGQFTLHNIDAIILGYCATTKNCNLGTSYLNFLNNENIKPNLATIGKYLKLLYAINEDMCFKQGKPCPKIEEELILRFYDDMRRQYPILDSISLENAILALSVTSQWKKCLDLFEDIKLTATPNNASYSAVVAAAFLNGDEHLAWKLLEDMILSNRVPKSIAIFAYISVLKKNSKKEVNKKLERLFLFFHNFDFKCKHDVAMSISDLANTCDLENKFVTIPYNGICFNCNKKLYKLELSNDEFEELKTNILQNVIIGKDIFVKSNPAELERFNKFIKDMGNYDVVLDGLNVAYSTGTKQSPFVLSSLLSAVVSYFVEKKRNVLVLGRVHMTRWPRKNWEYIMANARVFLTQNISQDDPYLLYCALNSGKNTVVVTRDLMRSHKFLLQDPKLQLLFNRWLSQRQYHLIRVDDNRGPIFRIPPPFSIRAQKNHNIWHIPYENDSITLQKFPGKYKHEFHKTWLCLRC